MPVEERHGLVWAIPGAAPDAGIDVASYLRELNRGLDGKTIGRTIDGATPDLPLTADLDAEADAVLGLFNTTNANEGISAFLERRPPVFGSGRR